MLVLVWYNFRTHSLCWSRFKALRESRDIVIIDAMLIFKVLQIRFQLLNQHLKHAWIKLKCSLKVFCEISYVISFIYSYASSFYWSNIYINIHEKFLFLPFFIYEARWLDRESFRFLIIFTNFFLFLLFFKQLLVFSSFSQPINLLIIASGHFICHFSRSFLVNPNIWLKCTFFHFFLFTIHLFHLISLFLHFLREIIKNLISMPW